MTIYTADEYTNEPADEVLAIAVEGPDDEDEDTGARAVLARLGQQGVDVRVGRLIRVTDQDLEVGRELIAAWQAAADLAPAEEDEATATLVGFLESLLDAAQ